MKSILLKIVFLVFLSLPLLGQEQEVSGVRLIAKAKRDTILLRWGPTNASVWSLANKQGYIIERFTITRGEQLLARPEKLVLTVAPLKPAPLASWEKNARINSYSAVAAEAIYSSSFDVSLPSKSVYEVISKTQELDQRYSFALLAADHSFETAKLSGLAFVDTKVKKNEKYFYRVFISGANPKVKLDTGICFISLRDTISMPPPTEVRAEFRDRIVRLTWPKAYLEKGYSSFIIERADDTNRIFRKLNKTSFLNLGDLNEKHFQFLDSLPANGVKYFFRIRGITPFGELGPASEEVSGMGFKKLMASARIEEGYESSPGKIKISWKLTGEAATIKTISVQRSSRADGKYSTVNKEKNLFEQSTYTDADPYPTNYYRIRLTSEQDSVFSFPYLVQLLDSIPPAPPQHVTGIVDTTGITKLAWTSNTEKDLLGYRVFRSNFLNSEFSQITHDPIYISSYSDTLELRSLTKNIYYKVVAVDQRFNPSDFSEVLKLEKPDIVPPAPPIFKSVVQKKTAVELIWWPSPSEDVSAYRVMRKTQSDSSWVFIKEVSKDSTMYRDKVPDVSTKITYALVATDGAGNKSPGSQPFAITTVTGAKGPVDNLSYSVDRQEKLIKISWKKSDREIAKYMVYRAEDDAALTLYKTINAPAEIIVDKNLIVNKVYRYRIKSVFHDGSESSLSKELRIKF